MQPDALERAREYLSYAEEDLVSCRVLLESPAALLGTASYHAQQAAEKVLKAFLPSREQPLVRTHDLGVLVTRCERLDSGFSTFTDAAARLTAFAVVHRYPGASEHPQFIDVRDAHVDAERMVVFVRARLEAPIPNA